MRRIITTLLCSALLSMTLPAQSVSDKSAMDAKLAEYVKAIEHASLPEQEQEVDFIISACNDKDTRTYVATELYRHFYGSKLMGAENVAVHILDSWFLNGKLKMTDDVEYLQARIFAEYNRQSLIGAKAQELTLKDASSAEVRLPEKGRWNVIYFYDTECSKCRIESVFLRSMIENHDFPINFYAVYIGSNKEQWMEYNGRNFQMEMDKTRVFLLRDEDRLLEFQKKYGILSTPKLFLIDPQGVVVGRNLDSRTLETILKDCFGELDYGSEASARFLDGAFEPYGTGITSEDVLSTAAYIKSKTLDQKDTTLYRQMCGDLLYYLTNRKEEAFKTAAPQFCQEYILDRGDIWYRDSDKMKVVSLAEMFRDITSINTVGEKLPQYVLKGRLLKKNDVLKNKTGKSKSIDASTVKNTIVFFYSESCENCRLEKEAMSEYVKANKGIRIFMVDVDKCVEADGNVITQFDLSSTPYILVTDKDGILTRKYFSMIQR